MEYYGTMTTLWTIIDDPEHPTPAFVLAWRRVASAMYRMLGAYGGMLLADPSAL